MPILSIFIMAMALVGCANNRMIIEDSGPLIAVIKLISAESSNDRLEAERYIDIKSVYDPRKYSDEITEQTPTASEIYDQYLNFIKGLEKDKKFSSEFMYHKYEIRETIFDGLAEVVFDSKELAEKITYKLKHIHGHWIVIHIVRESGSKYKE